MSLYNRLNTKHICIIHAQYTYLYTISIQKTMTQTIFLDHFYTFLIFDNIMYFVVNTS